MKVMIRVPVGKENPEYQLLQWAHWVGREHPEIHFAVHYCSKGPSEARNDLAEELLKSDCTHLWMIDADTVPPQRTDLLREDLPISCGWYLQWNPNIFPRPFPCVFKFHPTKKPQMTPYRRVNWPKDDFFVADAAGTGCMVVRRDVFEAFEDAPFAYGEANGTFIGEDLTFCARATLKGFPVWVHSAFRCHHYRAISLDSVDAAMAAAGVSRE